MDGAKKVAEHLRKLVEELHIENRSVPTGQVTVSLGAATIVPAQESTKEALTKFADQALYQAKHAGRNCVRSVEK